MQNSQAVPIADSRASVWEANGSAQTSQANSLSPSNDATQAYLRDIGRTPLLNAKQEIELAQRIRSGDTQARRKMIESNLRLVVNVARRYLNRGLPLLDMVEEGNLGLMHAVGKFDPDKGFRFSTYATWWIRQSIERGLMNQVRTIRLPVHIVKELNSCKRSAGDIRQSCHREATIPEIAERTGKRAEHIEYLMGLQETTTIADSSVGEGGNQSRTGNGGALERIERAEKSGVLERMPAENLPVPHQAIPQNEMVQQLRGWLQELPEKHRAVLQRRFGLLGYEPDTLENVGKAVGLTRERVRQIQIEGLKQLRAILGREGLCQDTLFGVDGAQNLSAG